MCARKSGCPCMHLHVLAVVGPLGEGHLAPGDIAHKGFLSCVDPKMICEVVSLLEKSSAHIIARETLGVIAFPELHLSLSDGVDIGEDTICRKFECRFRAICLFIRLPDFNFHLCVRGYILKNLALTRDILCKYMDNLSILR
jgi:hypothetical protein